MRLRAAGCTDTGRVRTLNEDTYICNPQLGLFVVCDGMGGQAAGEVASQLAIETITAQLSPPGSQGEELTAAQLKGFLPRTRCLEAALRLSNQVIYEESQKHSGRVGMGATVVSAWLGEHIASLGHVGDSRAYLWRNADFQQLTRDHSLAAEQARAGLSLDAEGQYSAPQHIVLRALGPEPEVEVELAEVPLLPGDYLLLCSDGLTGMVEDARLAEAIQTLREPRKICDHLVALANRNGGVDNITVVVVEVLKESWWQRLWSYGWRLSRRSR